MITYDKDIDLNDQIINDYKKLEQYKSSYEKKIAIYNKILDSGIITSNVEITKVITTTLNAIAVQICKIENALNTLDGFKEKDVSKSEVLKYNKKSNAINRNFVKNYMIEKKIYNYLLEKYNINTDTTIGLDVIEDEKTIEVITANETISFNEPKLLFENVPKYEDKAEEIKYEDDYTDSESYLENNDTLLISENIGKVILPYTADEVIDIMEKENYKSPDEVIEAKFTRPLSDFRFQFISRYAETIKLVTERAGFSLLDAVSLAAEMFGKRYLHPAIIAACRSVDELDVYLDCLDKGELDDFRIFKIKYELYPIAVKENKIFGSIKRLFEEQSGKHVKD